MTIRARKDIVVSGGTGTVDLSISDTGAGVLSGAHDQNIVLISTDAAITGAFDCFVEFGEETGFFGVTPIGGTGTAINAANVGSQVAVGDAEGWSFNGSPTTVRVTATGVTDGTYAVVVSQNHG